MKVTVVNCSRVYNVAAEKMAAYHLAAGDQVQLCRGLVGNTGELRRRKAGLRRPGALDLWGLEADLYLFSVVFTWDLPAAAAQMNLVKDRGIVRAGGPAATALSPWLERATGIRPHVGLAPDYDAVRGPWKVTFTSRGCIHDCPWCVVPRLEGAPVEFDKFVPAPVVADNNILATSWGHQERVVEALSCGARVDGVFYPPPRRVDFNSGFDARLFAVDPERVWRLYSRLELAPAWRTAFDSMAVEKEVEATIRFLRRPETRLTHRQVMCYVLIGFGDTPDEALYRARKVIEWGGSPYVMRYCPLSRTQRHYVNVRRGWTEHLLQKFVLYFNQPHIWRSVRWEDCDLWAKRQMRLRRANERVRGLQGGPVLLRLDAASGAPESALPGGDAA